MPKCISEFIVRLFRAVVFFFFFVMQVFLSMASGENLHMTLPGCALVRVCVYATSCLVLLCALGARLLFLVNCIIVLVPPFNFVVLFFFFFAFWDF